MVTLSLNSDEDLPPGLREIVERDRRRASRRSSHDDEPPNMSGVWSLLKNVLMVITLVGAAFTAGQNWHQIAALRQEYDKHVIDSDRHFARRDVVEEQNRAIQRQLEELKALIIRGG